MEDVVEEVLVLWKIVEDRQRGRIRIADQYRSVKTLNIFNQPWSLNMSSLNSTIEHVLLKRPSSNKVRVTGNLEMVPDGRDSLTENEPSTKGFVKILEANQKEVALPIRKCGSFYNPNTHFQTCSIEIHGYLNISEIASVPAEDKSTDGKFQLKAIAQLSNDLSCLLKEQAPVFADVNLKCQDVVIPAHRNILSARSPVFAAMFRNKMRETLDGTVCVQDIDPKICQIMLSYVYGGKTDKLTPATAGQLLFAADKYQLECLKEICSDCLKTNLTLENALAVLVLGDLHDGSLKSAVLNFICKSGKYSILENTKEWKSIQREKPQLAMEVLDTLVKYLYAIKK